MARIQAPLQQPWLSRLANRVMHRRYGKTFPAFKLLGHHPRYPFAYLVFSSIFSLGKTRLPKDLRRLATQLVAELNGCAFCIDLGQRLAQDEKLSLEKLQHVLEFETQPLFTVTEKAVLRYAFEATQLGARVSDETFSELKVHFSDREILELTVSVATENFYNRLNAPLEIASQGFCALPESQ